MAAATIKRGASSESDEYLAVAELYAKLQQNDIALTVFFCSPNYHHERLADAIKKHFGTAPVIGCTTAGEITPKGYQEGSITGFSLGDAEFKVVTNLFDNLQNFNVPASPEAVKSLQRLLSEKAVISAENTFGFLLVDGSSVREESVINGLYSGMGDIPIFGGSAGDGLNFGPTYLYYEGAFHTDCAILALIHTQRPFQVFKTQHFVQASQKMVVTEAIPEKRIVLEINAEPAGKEYARIVGLGDIKLTPMTFAAYPVLLNVAGAPYIRSIQQVNPDASLTFYCAIDEGIVLTVAKGEDIKANLLQQLDALEKSIGEPQLIISCDCILRRLELIDKNLLDEVGTILAAHNAIGFSTYGEQYQAMHINQTLTGVAIA
ncbi:Conserved hypothetical protein [gamma proteobacterium HdN1]|nr:Conserved hypothetical protein [gamma proteobacterium HdN1]